MWNKGIKICWFKFFSNLIIKMLFSDVLLNILKLIIWVSLVYKIFKVVSLNYVCCVKIKCRGLDCL